MSKPYVAPEYLNVCLDRLAIQYNVLSKEIKSVPISQIDEVIYARDKVVKEAKVIRKQIKRMELKNRMQFWNH